MEGRPGKQPVTDLALKAGVGNLELALYMDLPELGELLDFRMFQANLSKLRLAEH